MSESPQDDEISQLQQLLEHERERADRAEIEANIAWENLALLRELVVSYKLNITMLQGYEPIRELEGCNLQDEVSRRLAEKRAREQAAIIKRENDDQEDVSRETSPEEDVQQG